MSVLRSSAWMALGTIFSRILGFVRAILLAAMIGVTTNAADAFGVANQLPNNVYAIIVGGVLNAVLVPQLVKAHKNADGGKDYVDRLLTLAITVFAVITALTLVFAPVLVSLYTSGWSADQLALATAFAYWCLPQLFFYGLYSILGEVLNSRSHFGPFMWAPVLNNVVALAGMVAYIWIFGFDPTGQTGGGASADWTASRIALLAGAATAGVAAQALILFVSWRKIGLHFKPNFKWRGVGLRPALKAATWTLAMVIITQLAGIVQTAVTSIPAAARAGDLSAGTHSLEVASVAAASIAWLIFMLPHSVFTVSIATAYFTRLTKHAHDGEMAQFKTDLADGLRLIAMVSIIAASALMVLAYPIARVFVGEYPATVALGNVIVALMVGLLPFSFNFFMQKAFYAIEDTKTPFFITLTQCVVLVAGLLIIANTVPAQNLVVAVSLMVSGSIALQATLAALTLKKRIGSFAQGLVLRFAKFIVAAAIAAATSLAVLQLLGGTGEGSYALSSVVSAVIVSGISAAVMGLVFLVVLRLVRAPEGKEILSFVTRALQRIRGMLRR